MGWIGRFYRSTIGRKVVMAVTGIVLVVYLIGHTAGNLLVFRGPEAINDYAHFLQSSAALLWTVRIVLLLALVFHVHSAWTLSRDARAARPAEYRRLEKQTSGWPARSMGWGGVLLLVFVVYHILHFTTGTVHPRFVPGEVYDNLIAGLRIPAVAVFYLLAMIALALHLRHGIWSVFQTLGVSHPHVSPVRRRLAVLLALLVPVGLGVIPLAIVLGLFP
jgi:succinate dehydrogenase / fumarate reductase, cytochrome b subunit